jgi:hypothetical protein
MRHTDNIGATLRAPTITGPDPTNQRRVKTMSAGSNLRKAVEAEIPLQLVGTINESLLKVYKLLSIVRRLMSKKAPI